ncbi:MAG: T9SS type A sorting domain-containing protein, partial [Bacteroidota bacterium]
VYDQPTYGIQMEAVKATSNKTAARSRWGNNYLENRSYQQTYGNPVVLGQVMTENDADFSVFWSSQANSRTGTPTASSFAAGKHVAEDTDQTRADETIGYIVVEAGSGTINGEEYLAGVGADIVRGTQNSSLGYLYNTSSNVFLTGGVLSSAAMDGGDGGWPVFRASPIGNGGIRLAVEEDRIRDNERSHTTEQVAYFLLGTSLGNTPAALLQPETEIQVEALNPISSELRVFPNPTSGYVNLVLSAPEATARQLRILDLTGRVLQQRTLPNARELYERIALENIRPGIYLLQVVSGKERLTKRIIVR